MIGDAPVPVNPPGDEVAVYVTAPAPRSDGAVYATVAVLEPVAVAVPIVGAPGIRGQVPALAYCVAWSSVQIPLADAVVGAVGFLVMMPPGNCLMLMWTPMPALRVYQQPPTGAPTRRCSERGAILQPFEFL